MKSGKKPFYCALWPIAGHAVVAGLRVSDIKAMPKIQRYRSSKSCLLRYKTAVFRAFGLDHKKCLDLQRMLNASFKPVCLKRLQFKIVKPDAVFCEHTADLRYLNQQQF